MPQVAAAATWYSRTGVSIPLSVTSFQTLCAAVIQLQQSGQGPWRVQLLGQSTDLWVRRERAASPSLPAWLLFGRSGHYGALTTRPTDNCSRARSGAASRTARVNERAASLVSEDFSFQGPMQATAGREAMRKMVAHVGANARGCRVLRQLQDGDEVCSLYEFDVETSGGLSSVLVSEWNTVRAGQVATSRMVFDTGPFRPVREASAGGVDRIAE